MFRTGLASSSSVLDSSHRHGAGGARGHWRRLWSKGAKCVVTFGVVASATVGIAAGLSVPATAFAKETREDSPTASVPLSSLPRQAQETHRLILSGGPFPYTKDGVTFGNRERQLPRKNRGYYHEYTVKTPGSRDRGARRIVCGGEPKTQPEVCYYTADHYATFSRIAP